jgi:peptide/nickel transport system ATP-binding protein
MAEYLLSVEHLSKIFITGGLRRYEKIVAVDDISFGCNQGEIVGLIGESGSGKTTTARLLLKLLKPTSGKIVYGGKDVWTIPDIEYHRYVQGIFQDPYASLNPVYKISHLFSNTFVGLLKTTPKSEREEMIKNSLKLVHLNPEEVLQKHIYELSGGELQRVLLANSLLVNPEVIVADEPTSMIDASMRVEILNIFKDLSRKDRKLIIFITHDIGQAFYICDRIIVMYKGKIVEQGPAEQIVLDPQHSYTKRLISDVPKLHEKFVIKV